MKRFTPDELKALIPAETGNFREFVDGSQFFEFGEAEVANVDKLLAAELWHRKLLRLPFPRCIFTFRHGGTRMYLIAAQEVTVSMPDDVTEEEATAFVVISQGEERGGRADAGVWFKAPTKDDILAGAAPFSEVPHETQATFKEYTLWCVARLITLAMLLNTKGIPQRHEPVPRKLNEKRARSGKSPLPAVTYVDLSRIAAPHGSAKGGARCMHLRRGHIRHYDDGTTTWVRDCIVKADGELKVRERYEVKGESHDR